MLLAARRAVMNQNSPMRARIAPGMKSAFVVLLWIASVLPAAAQGRLSAFFGSLHDHTAQDGDDGKGTVAEALAAARANGFHFFGISPHNHMVSPGAYRSFVREMAAADEPGKFVPFAAFEWGAISKGGHVGVVGAADMITAENTDWDGFWRSVHGQADALVVLNHPIWGNTYGGPPDAARVARARLMEVMGGPGEYAGADYQGRGEFSHREFMVSSNEGWRCGVAYGEDNHSARWGRVNRSRTGVWAHELTRDGLTEALAARRTFVTEDPRMTVWIESAGTPMGGEAASGGGPLTVKIEHEGEAVAEVALYVDADGPGGAVAEEVERFTRASFVTGVKAGAPGAFAMVVARDASGDLAWSSPIWFGTGTLPRPDPNAAPAKVDLNFGTPAQLDRVHGVGRGTVKAITAVRRSGVVFERPEDLAKVPGLPGELYERVVSQFKVSTPEETVDAICQSLLDEKSLVATAARQTAAHYQAERAARLLALQLAPLARSGERARVRKLLAVLDAKPGREAARANVLKMLKSAALEGGWAQALDAALR